ncbi:MAG: metallophosphoesterase [Schwartzia succinivorans]|uniref:metallophosphoesterase n=1 Tax=Schwartzia succinivorans TaxID=55507 RepID=UPI0023579DEC|nr:metallophosphoesterase [Schwartzia succinivorans]MBE6098237.1 metallophosphoesterase [Schwartzia succinivorans]
MWFFWMLVLIVLFIVAALAWWGIGITVSENARKTVRGILVLFDVVSVLLLMAGRHLLWMTEPVLKYGMLVLTAVWMAELFFGLFALFARQIYKFIYNEGKHSKNMPKDPERRRFLKGAAVLPLAAAAGAGYGTFSERTRTVVREFDVPVDGLGPKADGFRIAQLSDVHLGLFYSLEDLKKLMEQAAATKADALVITGDLFDDDDINEKAAELIDSFCGSFAHGIWFCYGNHEYFRNISRTRKALGKTKIHVLVNDSARILTDTRPIYFCGADYPRFRPRFKELEEGFMKETVKGVPKEAVTVLLAHHPDFIDDASEYDVTLALTGHTHGGQLGLFGVPVVPPVFKYLRGKYIVGRTFGYVHCGNGSWFPFRFGCPPEIPVFRLTSA